MLRAGQNNYLLGTGGWSYALRINDDSKPDADLVYQDRTATVPWTTPPMGQGPFAVLLAPAAIKAKAQLLPTSMWAPVKTGRGAAQTCTKGTSINPYTKVWASPPPQSPVGGAGALPLVDVVLLPYGATDLRVGEFPTTAA